MVQTPERVCRQVGYPGSSRVDNGSEFISRDLDLWAYHNGVVLDFSRPGKPTDNSYVESFNGKFRAVARPSELDHRPSDNGQRGEVSVLHVDNMFV